MPSSSAELLPLQTSRRLAGRCFRALGFIHFTHVRRLGALAVEPSTPVPCLQSSNIHPFLLQVWREPLEREGPPDPEFAPPEQPEVAVLATQAGVPSSQPDPGALTEPQEESMLRAEVQDTLAQPAADALQPEDGSLAPVTDADAPVDADAAITDTAAPSFAAAEPGGGAERQSGLQLPDRGPASEGLQEDGGVSMDGQPPQAEPVGAAPSLPPLTRMVTRTMSRKRRSGLEGHGPDA